MRSEVKQKQENAWKKATAKYNSNIGTSSFIQPRTESVLHIKTKQRVKETHAKYIREIKRRHNEAVTAVNSRH